MDRESILFTFLVRKPLIYNDLVSCANDPIVTEMEEIWKYYIHTSPTFLKCLRIFIKNENEENINMGHRSGDNDIF